MDPFHRSSKENIFNEGDDGDCAFIIELGRIEIYTNDGDVETPISILGPGEIFGEMAVIDVSKRSASARSVGDTKLTIVYREQLISRIKEADAIVGFRFVTSPVMQGAAELLAYGTAVKLK